MDKTMLSKTFEVVSSPNGNTIQCDRTIRIGLALPLTFLLTNYLPVSFVVKSVCYVPLIHVCQLGV